VDKTQKINLWIYLLILLAILFAGGMGWSFYQAGTRVSSVVDPSYYEHGLHYNRTQLEQQAALESGWHYFTTVAHNYFEVRLLRHGNLPVSGCNGKLLIRLPGQQDLPASYEMEETGSGIYGVELPSGLEGEIQAEMILGKDNNMIKRNLLLTLNGSSQ
jgi:nitrogen fixation protein FixH